MVTYQDKYLEANNKKGTNFFFLNQSNFQT